MECLLTRKQRLQKATRNGREPRFKALAVGRDENANAHLSISDSSDSELSDDEGVRIMRSPNPFSMAQTSEEDAAHATNAFVPGIGRDKLYQWMDAELARVKGTPIASGREEGRGLMIGAEANTAAAISAVSSPASTRSENFIGSLALALDRRVPEYRHLKMESEQLRESPFTPRTVSLMALAKKERLNEEWRRQRALCADELADGGVLLSTQKPCYIDYCRCVRAIHHYSAGLPRWKGVFSTDAGDPCHVPSLYLKDVPKGGVGWRFYNFSISLSMALKIVQRKEAAKARDLVSTTGLYSSTLAPALTVRQQPSPQHHLPPINSGSNALLPPPTVGPPSPSSADASIDIIDIMHNLYPLYPMGVLKIAAGGWATQLRDEVDAKCRTRLEQLSAEEVKKTASIFHILAAGEADGTRVRKDAFLSRMPRGDRNVAAQIEAFSKMFDQHCRIDSYAARESADARRQKVRRGGWSRSRRGSSLRSRSSFRSPPSSPNEAADRQTLAALKRCDSRVSTASLSPLRPNSPLVADPISLSPREATSPFDSTLTATAHTPKSIMVLSGDAGVASSASFKPRFVVAGQGDGVAVNGTPLSPSEGAKALSIGDVNNTEASCCNIQPTTSSSFSLEPFMDLECLANALYPPE